MARFRGLILANAIVIACALLSQPAWSHEHVGPRLRAARAMSGQVAGVDAERGIMIQSIQPAARGGSAWIGQP